MIRAFRLPPLFCALVVGVLAATPAGAVDLPFFAGGDTPALKAPRGQGWDSAPDNPWSGWTAGAQVFGVSGSGRGTRGGFGASTFLGYAKEFDNNIVLGVSGNVGYLPGLWKCGPNGYNFGMANVSVGYDMGRFLPYVTFGVGTANATSSPRGGLPGGLDSVNNLFSKNAFGGQNQSVTLTRVGAGFDYQVTDHLRVGVEVSSVQAHGSGFGPPLVPQPGGLQ